MWYGHVKHKDDDDRFKCCTSSGLSETDTLSNEDTCSTTCEASEHVEKVNQ